MEEILDLYEEPYDPKRPVVVCFDERPCQLLAEVREPLAGKPGKPKRVDSEYERRGMANVLLAFEPLKGRREMRVTEQRRKLEFAAMMRYLLDDLYPEVERIRLVVDNLRARIHRRPSTRASLPKRQGACLERSSWSTRLSTDHG
jgi:DDE superfamily endonuclease